MISQHGAFGGLSGRSSLRLPLVSTLPTIVFSLQLFLVSASLGRAGEIAATTGRFDAFGSVSRRLLESSPQGGVLTSEGVSLSMLTSDRRERADEPAKQACSQQILQMSDVLGSGIGHARMGSAQDVRERKEGRGAEDGEGRSGRRVAAREDQWSRAHEGGSDLSDSHSLAIPSPSSNAQERRGRGERRTRADEEAGALPRRVSISDGGRHHRWFFAAHGQLEHTRATMTPPTGPALEWAGARFRPDRHTPDPQPYVQQSGQTPLRRHHRSSLLTASEPYRTSAVI
jgi:hypothetical protein